MSFTCFQDSLHDASNALEKRIREHVKGLPEAEFEDGQRERALAAVTATYRFPELPEFAGQAEHDPPTFSQGSDRATVTVYIPCKGDPTLFRLYHIHRPLSPPPPTFDVEDGFVVKTYVVEKQRLDSIDQLVMADIKMVDQYFADVRRMVPLFNQQLEVAAKQAFDLRLHEINANRQAAASLSENTKLKLRKRNDGAERIIVPVQRKPLEVNRRPQPRTTPGKATPVPEYEIGMAEYEDILSTISAMVKVMERTPQVFAEMNEEPLRTILLVALNGVYEGQATGETFNGYGKTDILIRKNDRNVFIAECLMWKGQAYLTAKMDEQLFQYAMWRDSKLALIVFNRGGKFTNAIETMKRTIMAHPQIVRQLDWKHESGARYVFRRHDDSDRHFMLTALAFDVPVRETHG